MAKYFLNTPLDPDFVLIGLRCSEDLYSIVNLVNTHLCIDLRLSENIPYNLKDGKLFNFSLFVYNSDEFFLDYYFISNLSNMDALNNSPAATDLFAGTAVEERVKLVKELPQTDYFLIVKGEDAQHSRFKIVERLKLCNEIVQIQNIEIESLPSKMNLMF